MNDAGRVGKWQVFCLTGLLVVLMTACKPSVPGEYIQPDEMEDILYDYHISQAMAYQRPDGEDKRPAGENTSAYRKNLYYYAVLEKYGVTEAEFDSSLVYYYSHADRLHKIYKRVSERMEKNAVSLGANVSDINKYSQLNANGDTANIWNGASSAILMPNAPYNRMDFKLVKDSTFRKGDSFLFNFMTNFLYQGGTKDAVIYMAVHYDNDSISTHVSHVTVSGLSQLRVPGNPKNEIKEIDGFVYLNRGNDESKTIKLMFVNQIQLIRFHSKEILQADSTLTDAKKDSVAQAARPDTLPKMRQHVDTMRRPVPVSGGMVKRSTSLMRHEDARGAQKSGGK